MLFLLNNKVYIEQKTYIYNIWIKTYILYFNQIVFSDCVIDMFFL